jgi:hypothetical protein
MPLSFKRADVGHDGGVGQRRDPLSARTPAQHATSVARRPWHPGGIAGASAVRLVKTERGGGSGQWLATNYSVTGSPVVVGGTVYHTDWAGYLTAVALKAGGCVADCRPRGNPGKNAVVLHCPNHCPTAPSSSANLAYLSQFWVTPGRSRKPLCAQACRGFESLPSVSGSSACWRSSDWLCRWPTADRSLTGSGPLRCCPSRRTPGPGCGRRR